MPNVRASDVATLAGVSRGTVSNYLNHRERVRPAAQERIQRAITALGYVPSEAGRMLRLGVSQVIGYVVPDPANPFFTTVAAGAEDRAREEGLSVLIANSNGDRQRELDHVDMFEALRVRGLLIAPVGDLTTRLIRLHDAGIPSVMVGASSQSPMQSSVGVDDLLGGRIAVEHLAKNGSRRILFVGGPLSRAQVLDRLTGATTAAAELGVTLEVVPTADNTIDEGRRIATAIAVAASSGHPDGIFAANDLLALGLVDGFARSDNLRVPDDVAIIGYDDIAFAASSRIPISSIRPPHEELGRVAVELLIRELDGDVGESPHIVFPPTLVARESTRRTQL